MVFTQDRSGDLTGTTAALSSISGGVGDLRLVPKLQLLRRARHHVDLALLAHLTLPSGSGSDFRGEDGYPNARFIANIYPFLALSAGDRLHWTVNGGYRARYHKSLANIEVDDELRVGVGAGFRVLPKLDLAATLNFATAANDPLQNFAANYLELIGGPTYAVDRRVSVFAGGGVGLRQGYGTPDWRGLAGVRIGTGVVGGFVDRDHDGILERDKCPDAAEDFDRFQDEDGCPELDNDNDGILDTADGCPNDAEDKDGFRDDDGCPDPDNDEDGILDAADTCPDDPETINKVEDEDGCPEGDRDGDKIVDQLDTCPDVPEDFDHFEDDDGCVDDNDADGVADVDDKCPEEAGPASNQGCPDNDGDGIVDRLDNCPDEPGTLKNHGCKERQLATIVEGAIELLDSVYFDTDKAVIQTRSFKLLDNVAAVIAAHPEITQLLVEGHTDSQGNDAHNLDLSQRRAESVKAYLVARRIDVGRLQAKGFGETTPVADNRTGKGRASNRRVEFKIRTPGAVPTTP